MADSLETDQPITPAGRFFLQSQTEQVIHCAIAGKHPIDVDAMRIEIQNSIMLKHPRFCSLMVRDSCGREHWRKTAVNVDRHIIIHHNRLSDDPSVTDEDSVNDYIADLCISPNLPTDKPLWEIHLLTAHKTAVFRMHHALGDGISLMSMLLSYCRRIDDPYATPTICNVGSAKVAEKCKWNSWTFVKVIWYTLVYCLEFLLRGLWLRDEITAVSGGSGVELWPRRLATARFSLEDMKVVKRAVANGTINDVLFGVISKGLSRYLEIRSPKVPIGLKLKLTGLAMVNLRSHGGLQDMTELINGSSGTSWGNKFGMVLLPIYYKKDVSDPLQFVKDAKAMIDKKKLSLEAPFSYKIGNLVMSLFGAKPASTLNYRILCNTTFTISNIVGSREEITIAGNPVKYIRVTSSSLPHAISMHMMSYAGMADMQIQVAKDIIPDPKVLAKCFEDALLEMKEAAESVTKS